MVLTIEEFDRLSGLLDERLLERDYEERASAYFGRIARRVRVVDLFDLAGMVEDAVERGDLTEPEREEVMDADLVCTGWSLQDGTPVRLLAELAVTIDSSDVVRATHRAQLLAHLGLPVLPVVAGAAIIAAARDEAEQSGVWTVLASHRLAKQDRAFTVVNGRTHAPPGA